MQGRETHFFPASSVTLTTVSDPFELVALTIFIIVRYPPMRKRKMFVSSTRNFFTTFNDALRGASSSCVRCDSNSDSQKTRGTQERADLRHQA